MADTAVGPPPNAGSKTRRPSQRLASEEKIVEPPRKTLEFTHFLSAEMRRTRMDKG